MTLVDLRQPTHPEVAGFRGGEMVYPASVTKMFYLVAAHRWLEDGRLTNTAELRRALRDMSWTSETRHDAAYVELPTGERFVLVTFTVGHAKEKGIIPAVARAVIEGLRDVK